MLSLWAEDALYQCSFDGMSRDEDYTCDDSLWTISYDACDDGTSDYKLVIDNSNSHDGVIIESAFLRLNNANYSMDTWCVSDSDDVPAVDEMTESSSNLCSSGYTSYDDVCLDYEESDCAPGMDSLRLNG